MALPTTVLWTLAVMVITTTGLPPTSTAPPVADDSGRQGQRQQRGPESRIRPIASKPLDVLEGQASSDADLAANYLRQFGFNRKGKPLNFLRLPPVGSGSGQDEDEQTQALRFFQSYFGLQQTGQLDQATLQLMKKDRCGVADIPDEQEDSSRQNGHSQSPSGYSLLGTKWDKNRLSWKIDTTSTNQVTPGRQRQIMREALEMWRRVAPLDFEERSRGSVDIDIKFGSHHHGDDYPFDGKGKVLAHAFGPGQGTIDGDMHFDDDEQWSLEQGDGGNSDLLLVAAHELGHSLGLSHSRDPAALMYPYYGLTDRLGPDDIKAIQSLYGIRIGQPTTRAPVTTRRPRPTTKRPITRRPYTRRPRPQTTTTAPTRECGVQFDVVIKDPQRRDVYNGIQGDQVYRFNARGVFPGFPVRLHSVFPGAPRYAETVFTVPEKSATYFVKDNKVWRYLGSRLDPAYPKDLNPTHFPEVIRFVLPIVDSTGHRRIFVFGRTLWWEYNFDDIPTSTYYRPRPNLIPQYWPAISSDVSYPVMGTDNYIYLITPNGHVVLDSFRRALNGGKQEGHPQWLRPACRMRSALTGTASSVQLSGLPWVMSVLTLLLAALFKC